MTGQLSDKFDPAQCCARENQIQRVYTAMSSPPASQPIQRFTRRYSDLLCKPGNLGGITEWEDPEGNLKGSVHTTYFSAAPKDATVSTLGIMDALSDYVGRIPGGEVMFQVSGKTESGGIKSWRFFASGKALEEDEDEEAPSGETKASKESTESHAVAHDVAHTVDTAKDTHKKPPHATPSKRARVDPPAETSQSARKVTGTEESSSKRRRGELSDEQRELIRSKVPPTLTIAEARQLIKSITAKGESLDDASKYSVFTYWYESLKNKTPRGRPKKK